MERERTEEGKGRRKGRREKEIGKWRGLMQGRNVKRRATDGWVVRRGGRGRDRQREKKGRRVEKEGEKGKDQLNIMVGVP